MKFAEVRTYPDHFPPIIRHAQAQFLSCGISNMLFQPDEPTASKIQWPFTDVLRSAAGNANFPELASQYLISTGMGTSKTSCAASTPRNDQTQDQRLKTSLKPALPRLDLNLVTILRVQGVPA